MKVIVCTGDSHTCGQGADSIKSAQKPKNPHAVYDTSGLGIGMISTTMDDNPSYVNLLRQYVQAYTGSANAVLMPQQLCETYGLSSRPYCEGSDLRFCQVEKELVIENDRWEMLNLCAAEQSEQAQLEVYLDGKLTLTETFYTPHPRYTGYSFRNILVDCKGAKEIKIVPVSGTPCLRHIELASGEYMVLNSGVGSCSTKRYLQTCLECGVEALKPDIIVAEGQTINDWIHYTSAQEHYDWLKTMMETYKQGRKLLFCTVSPILGKQENDAGALYEDFIAASKQMAQDLGLEMADAHAVFQRQMEGMSPEEKNDFMYVDRWHVNAKGHKIYADTIWEKLKPML